MILKEIAHKVAQAFRLAQAADKKLSTGIAAALDAKQCNRPEYWGEMRWLSGKCTCRNCYRANWQDENKAL